MIIDFWWTQPERTPIDEMEMIADSVADFNEFVRNWSTSTLLKMRNWVWATVEKDKKKDLNISILLNDHSKAILNYSFR